MVAKCLKKILLLLFMVTIYHFALIILNNLEQDSEYVEIDLRRLTILSGYA